ncbi:cholinesterase-like [Dermacentor variabilis]|uniref:cholinesterase-like n=1 Tax=Dermacentor variabilis TaxID=34621 RepID=UPI003F5AED6C
MHCFVGPRSRKRSSGTWKDSFFAAVLLSWVLPLGGVVVSTTEGKVRGISKTVLGKDIEVFLGIPYAVPPTGDLRFRKPKPVAPWQGIYNATSIKDSCMQPRVPQIFYIPTPLSEDCLYLNVWTPEATKEIKVPVLVWFFGGTFKIGSAYERRYDGAALAALKDVVVVSCNFRSGMFGFLDANTEGAPGNVALWDQRMVMQWVQRNIKSFGGDPDLVTAVGESSGAMDIHLHLMSPFSAGLFHRMFSMSGTETSNSNVDSVFESISRGNAVAALLGCANVFQDLTTHPEKVLQCLRSKPAQEIVDATENATTPCTLAFFPTFNTEFIPYLPSIASDKGLYTDVDVVVSVVANEGGFFFLMQSDKQLLQDDLSDYEYSAFLTALDSTFQRWLKKKIVPLGLSYLENSNSSSKAGLRQTTADFIAMHNFYCPTKLFSEDHSDHGGTVYGMVFGHRSQKSADPEWVYVAHMEEIPYFFGIPFLNSVNYTDEDQQVSAYAMEVLVSFARDGKPAAPDGLEWPAYSAEEPKFMWLQPGNYSLVDYMEGDACALWRNF